MVVALLPTMWTAVEFHHQPCLMTIEVNDVSSERMLSSEMDPQAVAAQLLPHDALFGSQVPAQLSGPPHQLRIDLFAQDQWQAPVVLAYGQSLMEYRPYPQTPSPKGKGSGKSIVPVFYPPHPLSGPERGKKLAGQLLRAVGGQM
jgi:hypothetical protein